MSKHTLKQKWMAAAISVVLAAGVFGGIYTQTARAEEIVGSIDAISESDVEGFIVEKEAQEITTDFDSITLYIGSTSHKVFLAAETSGDGKLVYSSEDPDVASVNSNGKITAKKTGTTIITIKAKSTDSCTSATKTVKVTVKKLSSPTLETVKKSGTKLSLEWSKISAATGYQIQYSTDSDFESDDTETVKIKSADTTEEVLTGLTKGKTYYVRIRTYKKVCGVTAYSAWSDACSTKN